MELQNVLKDDTGDFTSTIRPSSSLVFIIAAFSIPINNLSPSTGLSVCIKLDIFFNFSILFFKFFFFLIDFSGERKGEEETSTGCLLQAPYGGSNPQVYAPGLGIKLATFWCTGPCPAN